MKKEILEALKAKFQGVSDSILGRIAVRLAGEVLTVEQAAAAVERVTIQQVLESYGDSRATEAQQTAVANYEKKHGLRKGRKVDGGAPKTEPDKETSPAGGGGGAPAADSERRGTAEDEAGGRQHSIVVEFKYEVFINN